MLAGPPLLSLFLLVASSALVDPAGQSYYSPRNIGTLPENFEFLNVTARLVEPATACSALTNADLLKGKIAVIQENSCTYGKKFRNALQAGAVGAIVYKTSPFDPDFSALSVYPNEAVLNNFPVVIVKSTFFEALQELQLQDADFSVSFSPDTNLWRSEFCNEWWFILFLQVLPSGWCVVNAIFAVVRLWQYISYGLGTTLPVALLSFELLANLLRLLFFGVDPILSRGVYNWTASSILASLSAPFACSASICIAFYWVELTDRRNAKVSTRLVRFKKPAIGIIAFLIVFEVVGSTLRGLDVFSYVFYLISGLYVIINFGLAIFFILSGVRILRTLMVFGAGASRFIIKRVTTMIVTSAFGMIVSLLGFILFVTPVYSSRLGTFFVWTLFGYSFNWTSIFHILAFKAPKQQKLSSNTSTKGSDISMDNTMVSEIE